MSSFLFWIIGSYLLSQYDQAAKILYGFETDTQLHNRFSTVGDTEKVCVPLLAVQPADDPLYMW